ncbi:NAD-dependent DNA ligase LigA [Mycoplasma phocoenae]|uniref:DNA ligase n=1 Tax=Mycoplasma phocoenae TaxID=754517 RepID=A0A858U1F1_9MOLU|nr:NAD-dependent DNA ligase LigA [Mycoplasma phocoenae]QJG66944.1 NAD-dependent DNA ligase LigA [Mycoplasma phocoenae]
MSKNINKQYIVELRNKIIKWNHAYFDLDAPIVEDAIYDKAIIELQKLESEYAHLFTEEELLNSPTAKIGANVNTAFAKVTHNEPMLSLQKSYEQSEIEKWQQNIEKVLNKPSYFIEPKIDGLSISLHYSNGKLRQALTRGDGLIGEDVTHNVLVIEDIPKSIDYKEDVEFRGEIYLKLSNFEILNARLEKQGMNKLANPRNTASGSIRQLNSDIVKERNLSCFIYSVIEPMKHNLNTLDSINNFIKTHNFKTTGLENHVYSITEIMDWIEEFKIKKTHLDYETDGVVIKLNEINFYDELGSTQKYPRWAIAYKYEPNVATTVMKNIFLTVGRTGMVTYNAELEPVELSGSIISAATLHNYDYISSLNIDINDLVYIKKAGEIIPKVISTVKSKDNTTFKRATHCPFCNSALIDSETGIDQYCVNKNCPEINLKKIIHFCSKTAMDIVSLGENNIEFFNKMNILNSFTDIYKLKNYRENLIKIKGFGVKSIDKLIENIENSKNNSLEKLIHALSIKLVGEKIAYFLASQIKKLSNLLTFDFNSLLAFNEIGEKIVASLYEYVNDIDNKKIVNDLIDAGLDLEFKDNIKSFKLINYSFVITGTLTHSRNKIQKMLVSKGAKVTNVVTKNTSFLITGEKAGSKLSKARALGVPVISEEELFEQFLN